MSSKPEQKGSEEKRGGVNISHLPRREAELTDEEAKQTKGGGGLSGGVIANRQQASGEEIPQ